MKTDKPSSQAAAQITIPLDIPGVRVLQVEVNDRGDFLISVEIAAKISQTEKKSLRESNENA